MHNDSNKQYRRSIRLPHYDYGQPGGYFVTICTHNRDPLFGEIVNAQMVCNDCGRIVTEEWLQTKQLRSYVELDAFVVMPNHVHGVIMILDNDGDAARADMAIRRGMARHAPTRRFGDLQPRTLATIVGSFKSAVTKRINELRRTPGAPVWQRNYYEHIIRNENELHRIRDYIINNPAQWQEDHENPQNLNKRK